MAGELIMKNILLTGGTGQLGKKILKQFEPNNYFFNVLTRQENTELTGNINYLNTDLAKIASLEDALDDDYEVVIHSASNPQNSDLVDVEGTRNLLKTIQKRNVKHFIYISIVGIDQSQYKYYQDKLAAEELIIQSGIPYTILRITQFHDFVLNRIIHPLNIQKDNDFEIPQGLKFQSIDLTDVCEKIRALINSEPTNSRVIIGGPEILTIEEIVRIYLDIFKLDNRFKTTAQLDLFGKTFTTGINLCPDNRWGKITWKDFLLGKISKINNS